MTYKLYLLISLWIQCTNRICYGFEAEGDNTFGNCTFLKNKFAETVSEFTQCSINYSRPITLCQNCIDNYVNLLDSYKNMSEVTYNGTQCLHYYINLDRLQIVQTQYSNSVSLWNRAKCYECYLIENGTQTRNESDVAKQFRNYYDNFNNCTHNIDAQNVCRQCMDDYVILSNFYESISNTNERIGVCIDLEDLMNSTWTFWSTNCCKYRRHNEYLFIGSTTSVLILTVLLYIIVQFCGEKKAPIIIQQSRFAGSINRL